MSTITIDRETRDGLWTVVELAAGQPNNRLPYFGGDQEKALASLTYVETLCRLSREIGVEKDDPRHAFPITPSPALADFLREESETHEAGAMDSVELPERRREFYAAAAAIDAVLEAVDAAPEDEAELSVADAVDTLRQDHDELIQAYMATIDAIGDVQAGRGTFKVDNLRAAAGERFRKSVETRELVIAYVTGDSTGIDQFDAAVKDAR